MMRCNWSCNWKLASTLTLLALVMLPLATARADDVTHTTFLFGENVVPMVVSDFSGLATLDWNATTAELEVVVVVQKKLPMGPSPSLDDLEDFPLHIHGPAMSGENADVILQLGGESNWVAADPGVSITTTFYQVLTGSEIMSLSCIDDADCLLAFQEALDEGMIYMNYRTVQNPNGELRGQIEPVPEPAASALAAVALTALGLVAKLRRGR